MDTDLDDQLASAAPPVAERTAALHHALSSLVDATETATRARRQRRRAGVAATAFALTAVAGVGTAAAAGLGGPGWWDGPDAVTHRSTTESGQSCSVSYAPRAVFDPDHPVAARDRASAMEAAAEFLRAYDDDAVHGASSAAAFDDVNSQLTRSLSDRGLSTYAVSVGMYSDCASEVER
jgi:hypothetical protein